MNASSRVRVVAEAAQGFEGNERLASLLVRAAKAGDADVVKFQLVFADELATRDYPYYGLFRSLEMPEEAWARVAGVAASAGLELAFDIFGERSLDLALQLGASGVKLHASDFFNGPLIAAAFARAPHIYLSIGGMEYDDVARVLDANPVDDGRLTLMFGFQGEPTGIDDNHIARLAAIRGRFPRVRLGFMDHADGTSDEATWLGVMAVAYGVQVVEKHVTAERSLQLEDWVSALDPPELALYVSRIRAAERALGNPALELSAPERAYGQRALKMVVARQAIAEGSTVGPDDVVALRAPVESGRTVLRVTTAAIGRRALRPVAEGRPIYTEDLG
jgi:sialic acid synthase SpsE